MCQPLLKKFGLIINLVAHVLKWVVILETATLVAICLGRISIFVKPGISPNTSTHELANPLYEALKYEASDSKFAKLVEYDTNMMFFTPPGASNSILALCAELKRTNYLRILITNGADVNKAINDETSNHNEEAIQLLQLIMQSETKR